MRRDVLQYAAEQYGTEPDYPWAAAPEIAVFRHEKSRKWYAAILVPARGQLGLAGEGRLDVLNLKCDPVLSGSLRLRDGILPGYHMNKEHWITVLLDGTVADEDIFRLLDFSYELTAG